jgi:hypothetical protein
VATIRPRDLLSDELLGELGRPGALTADIGRLADVGYLSVALPPDEGGLGCTLRQAACGQRRLARYAPQTALAVCSHLYWTGAAADACRAGDESVRWILAEAARGALLAGGHGEPGADLKFAGLGALCDPDGAGSYVFRDSAVLSTETPCWDWLAVHAVHAPAAGGQPQCVIAFAGRDSHRAPGFRVARVVAPGAPGDVFTTSALTWGHSLLASVQYSDARRAFNDAITALAQAATPEEFAAPGGQAEPGGFSFDVPVLPLLPAQGAPAPRWPVAEAGVLLDAMKARIADVTHPWQLVQDPLPDVGGQHLIGLHAMRHEIAEGAASVHALAARLSGRQPATRPLPM